LADFGGDFLDGLLRSLQFLSYRLDVDLGKTFFESGLAVEKNVQKGVTPKKGSHHNYVTILLDNWPGVGPRLVPMRRKLRVEYPGAIYHLPSPRSYGRQVRLLTRLRRDGRHELRKLSRAGRANAKGDIFSRSLTQGVSTPVQNRVADPQLSGPFQGRLDTQAEVDRVLRCSCRCPGF
jgi:hypothetical protein